MGCNKKFLFFLIAFFAFAVFFISQPVLAVGMEACTTNSDCYKGGAKFCSCAGVEKTYCLDGESWYVQYYYCANPDQTGMKCRLSSSTSSQQSQYICDNGNSVWNNAQENSCNDGKDDDYDGATDCSDSECAINQVCATTTTSLPACTQGSAIPTSGCVCGGYNYYSGYCCSYAYSSTACGATTTTYSGTTTTTYSATTTTVQNTCNANSQISGCYCSGTYYSTGYCCYTLPSSGSGYYYWQSQSCGTTTTTSGATTTTGGSTTTTIPATTVTTTDTTSCSATNYWNCKDETTCKAASRYWCSSTYTGGGASSSWCSSTPCTETDCKSANRYWCTGSSGSGWCQENSCPSCSSTQQWNCYSKDACTGAGGYWCNNYCSSSSCPTCSSTQRYNCNTETDCKTNGGTWCTPQYSGSGWCQDYSCPSYKCSSSETWNCKDETSCTGAGASWCKGSGGSSWCQSGSCPSCSSTQKYNCYTDTECKNAGGSWCSSQYGGSSWCQDSSCPAYKCSSSEPWNCKTESECKTAGVNWCGTYCQSGSCPTCSKSQPWNCQNDADCKNAGASWCKSQPPSPIAGTTAAMTPLYSAGWCQEGSCPSYTCSQSESWNCKDSASCTGAGASWCTDPRGGYGWCQQTSCPSYSCSAKEYWNCYNEAECTKVGASWCKGSRGGSSWCQLGSCPTCSSSQKYNCYSNAECTGAGGNWCGQETTGWCQDYSCPTCSSSQPWNCYDKSTCEGANGKWCASQYTAGVYSSTGTAASTTGMVSSGWCQTYDCPSCSKSQPWNCYSETDCTTNGGNWCGTWCQEGSYPCPSTKSSTYTTAIPEGCKETKDSATGFVKVVCETKLAEKCPTIPVEAKEKCVKYGGEFVIKKDERGCEFADCRFAKDFNEENKFVFEKFDRCPTEKEAEKYEEACTKTGYRIKYNVGGGCKIPICLQAEEHQCDKEINPKMAKEIEEKCKKEGLEVVKDMDPRGCDVLHCAEPNFCKKVPQSAYTECDKRGGELVVKNDDKGCAVFSECIKRGEEKVYLEQNEKIEKVPEGTKLLEWALKLEELKITFDKMAKTAKSIANYYESAGNLEAKKFSRVADMLDTAKDKVDEIKIKLKDRLSTLTTDDIEEIKLDVRTIRKVVLKDILYVMLSTKDEVDEIKEDKETDCGEDTACFEKNFRICKKTIFTPENGLVRISGVKNSKCAFDAEVKTKLGAFTMKCEVPGYALGFKNAEKDILPFCTGTLVTHLKETPKPVPASTVS